MREAEAPRWLLAAGAGGIPLPWLAVELGWFVAEFGRQPWIIDGVLPTFLATSELGVYNLIITIIGFTAGLWRARRRRDAADAASHPEGP